MDFGCGPTIHFPVSPSRFYDEIYFADFKENTAEIEKWIKKDPDAFDWTHVMEKYAKLEGYEMKINSSY